MLTGKPPFEADSLVGVAMKHVNEPMPDVQEKRPDASSALAAVIERSTLKEPKKRYSDMGAMLAELEGALEVEVARSGTAHGEATTVLDTVSDRRRLLPSRRASLAGIALVLAGTAAALLIAGLTGKNHGQSGAPPPGVPSGAEIPLSAATAFDPIANDGENDDLAKNAVDADPETAWPTSTYQNSPVLAEDGKAGVGLIVDAARPVSARTMEVTTAAHGWSADIYASASSAAPTTLEGWGTPIGDIADATTDQQIQLNDTSSSRYFLIWITHLSPEATIAPTGGIGGYNVQIKDVKLFSEGSVLERALALVALDPELDQAAGRPPGRRGPWPRRASRTRWSR